MSLQDDLNELQQKKDSRPPMIKYGDRPGNTIPNNDMNNNLDNVTVFGNVSADAAQISLDSANDAYESKQSAETLLALVTGTVDLPDFTVPNAPLMVNSTETGVIFGDTSVYELRDSLTALPTVKPVLMADFANSRQVDGRFEFSRNSEDYRDGRVYVANEPVVTEQGLWVSGERTNLIPNSENIDTWTKDNCTVERSGDWFEIVRTVVTGEARPRVNGIPVTPNTIYTTGVEAKAGAARYIRLVANAVVDGSTVFGSANYDLQNGVVSYQSSGSIANFSASIKQTKDVFLCSLTANSMDSTTRNVYINVTDVPNGSGVGDPVGSSVFIKKPQLTAGVSDSPYIPTTGSQITVVYSNTETKIDISENINLILRCTGLDAKNLTGFGYILGLSNGVSTANYLGVRLRNSDNGVQIVGSGTTGSSPILEYDGGAANIGISIKDGLVIFFFNGAKITTLNIDVSIINAVNSLFIGGLTRSSGFKLRGLVKSLSVYDKPLTEIQMQELTS